ncbi:hypothetical protein HDU97_003012 [Phlyctochytrium planicorne]|nr:hypothetical protein HDU97_003012 [Phlyctochytrium planicorne]
MNCLILVAVFSLVFARAENIQTNTKGATSVSNSNLIAYEIGQIIKTNCIFQNEALVALNLQLKLDSASPSPGAIFNMAANLKSAGLFCRAEIQAESPTTSLRTLIDLSYQSDAQKDVAASAISALLRQGNGRFPRELTLQSSGANVRMLTEAQNPDTSCLFGAGSKKWQGDGLDFYVTC